MEPSGSTRPAEFLFIPKLQKYQMPFYQWSDQNSQQQETCQHWKKMASAVKELKGVKLSAQETDDGWGWYERVQLT